MVLGKGQERGAGFIYSKKVNGASGGRVEALGALPMVVDGKQWKV